MNSLYYFKKYCLFFVFSIIFSCSFSVSCNHSKQESNPVLNRLVLFKYKAEVTQVEIEKVKQTFFELKEKIPGMLDVVWARDIDFNREKQFTFALILSFSSEETQEIYMKHPDHQALLDSGPEFENLFVMNYWTE